jgi:Holliday junction DNA helicase RuvA
VIGYLAGRVAFLGPDAVVLDVGGVGYEVRVAEPADFLPGATAEIYVHTSVRADAITLYGFASLEERRFFELLLATPGVGPSTALGALRTMPLAQLAGAVEAGDAKRISLVPGIGPKTASRIVLELKGKLVLDEPTAETAPSGVGEALRALGYSPAEVREATEGLDPDLDEGDALRRALSRLRRP